MEYCTPEIAWNYECESINSIDFNPAKKNEMAVCSTDQGNSGIFLRVS